MPTNNFTSYINSAVSNARCRAFETAFCFSLFKISLIYFIFQNRRIYSLAHQKQKFFGASHLCKSEICAGDGSRYGSGPGGFSLCQAPRFRQTPRTKESLYQVSAQKTVNKRFLKRSPTYASEPSRDLRRRRLTHSLNIANLEMLEKICKIKQITTGLFSKWLTREWSGWL